MSAPPTQQRTALAKYLDRVRSAYPYGIPRSLLVGVAPQPEPVLISFLLIKKDHSVTPEEGALLDSIITKGLQMQLSSTSREVFANAEDIKARLCCLCAEQQPRVVVVLGDPQPDGRLEVVEGSTVLFSHSLESMISTPTNKRPVWIHLQSITASLV